MTRITCRLHLNNFLGEYYPGNTIKGTVFCSFPTNKRIGGIEILIVGKEYTRWPERLRYSLTENSEGHTVHQSGSRAFLNIGYTVIGRVTHPAGQFAYHFRLDLPDSLPSTYECKNGWVLYNITSIIATRSGSNLQDTKEFKVMAPIDFNEMSVSMIPLSYLFKKNYSQTSTSYGPIIMKVHLEKSGFVLGEMIRVRVNVRNMSTASIARIEVRLEMTIKCLSKQPHREIKTESEVLETASGSGVDANSFGGFLFGVRVPESTELPNFTSCQFFQQLAAIYVRAILKGPHPDMEFKAPIKLGHIPKREPDTPSASPTLPLQTPPESLTLPSQAQVIPVPLAGVPHLPLTNDYRPQIAYIELLPPYSDFDTIPCLPFFYQPVLLPPMPYYRPHPPSSVPTVPPTEQLEASANPVASHPPSNIPSVSPTEQSEESRSSSLLLLIPSGTPTEPSEESTCPSVPSTTSSLPSMSPTEPSEECTSSSLLLFIPSGTPTEPSDESSVPSTSSSLPSMSPTEPSEESTGVSVSSIPTDSPIGHTSSSVSSLSSSLPSASPTEQLVPPENLS